MFHMNWLQAVAILMLAGALAPVPYFAYYQLMNWVVVGAAGIVAWRAYEMNRLSVMWVFIFVAVVFNPLAPLHLRADVWQIVDIVAAVLFLLSFAMLYKKKK